MAGPLTNILNRYPVTALAAAQGDELALIVALIGYTGRSIGERKAALAAAETEVDAPLSGPQWRGQAPADDLPDVPVLRPTGPGGRMG